MTVSPTLAVIASVGDPENTRTLLAIVGLLTALGFGLVLLFVWLFRVTRPDPDLLAPLEVMGERKWRRADPVWQRRRLDQVRPDDAHPLQPSVAPPAFDAAFDDGPTVSGFDDLHDDPESPEATSRDDRDDHGEHDELVDEEATASGGVDPLLAASAKPVQQRLDFDVLAPTPLSIQRPDELPEGELDPDVMAAAIADLDAELARRQIGEHPSD